MERFIWGFQNTAAVGDRNCYQTHQESAEIFSPIPLHCINRRDRNLTLNTNPMINSNPNPDHKPNHNHKFNSEPKNKNWRAQVDILLKQMGILNVTLII